MDEHGFEIDMVRTLVVRYPYILSKSSKELTRFFEIMANQGITEEETMRALLDCPKLISRKDLEHQIKEIHMAATKPAKKVNEVKMLMSVIRRLEISTAVFVQAESPVAARPDPPSESL